MSLFKKKLFRYKLTLSASFFTYLFGSILNLLASYGLLIFLLNSLPKVQYGLYGLYSSFLSLLLIFFNFGHKEAVFKIASKESKGIYTIPLDNVLTDYYQWNLCILIIIQALLFIDIIYYVAVMLTLMNGWLITFTSYYRGRSIYKVDALTLPLQRVMWLLSALFIYTAFDTISLLSVFTSSMLATVISLLFVCFPFINKPIMSLQNNKWSRGKTKLLFNFFIIELASVFYLKADVLLLRFFSIDLASIADYFFAIQLFEIVVLIIMPIGYFYFNSLTKNNINADFFKIKKNLIIMFFIVFSIHLGVFILAPIVFPIIIPDYTSSISIVLLIMFSLYPVCINILLSSRLIFDNKEVLFAKICFSALIFNFVANMILIPYFDIYAVLLIKFLTETLIALLLIKVLYFPTKSEAIK